MKTAATTLQICLTILIRRSLLVGAQVEGCRIASNSVASNAQEAHAQRFRDLEDSDQKDRGRPQRLNDEFGGTASTTTAWQPLPVGGSRVCNRQRLPAAEDRQHRATNEQRLPAASSSCCDNHQQVAPTLNPGGSLGITGETLVC